MLTTAPHNYSHKENEIPNAFSLAITFNNLPVTVSDFHLAAYSSSIFSHLLSPPFPPPFISHSHLLSLSCKLSVFFLLFFAHGSTTHLQLINLKKNCVLVLVSDINTGQTGRQKFKLGLLVNKNKNQLVRMY